MTLRRAVAVIALVVAGTQAVAGQSTPANEALWEAARAGDTGRIKAALSQGADVNAKSRYDVTALIFAAGSGRLGAVKLLLSRGANIDAQDSFYKAGAVDMAATNGHVDVALALVQSGANGDSLLSVAVQEGREDVLRAAIAGRTTPSGLRAALTVAERVKREALLPALREAVAKLPGEPSAVAAVVPPETLARYVGTYSDEASGLTFRVTLQGGGLALEGTGIPPSAMIPTGENVFSAAGTTVTFNGRGGLVESVSVLVQGGTTLVFRPARAPETAAATAVATPAARPAVVARPTGARPWSSFRGEGGAGNGDGQGAVTDWDVTSGRNVKWKTAIPGISVSSPVIWGNRVFVTTAVGSGGDKTFKTGLYGDVKPVDDLSPHEWKILSLDTATGKVLWERVASTGPPRSKRHTKSSQASSSPATDGRRIVASFGSAGVLAAWDFSGRELWRVDLGTLDSGWFFDPAFQWGHSSSPIIHRDLVILQADVQKGSYLAAWDVATGKLRWRTERVDEISTWGTPAVAKTADGREVIVTNGTRIRGYDPATGKELWRLGPNSEITIGTPVSANGLVFVTGGYPPVRPVYAIRPGSSGDISLEKGQDSNAAIAWSNMTEGTYIPTPLVYGPYLFTLQVTGVVTAYELENGKRAFRGRVGTGGAFSASPVAADGRLYVASEDGEVYVVAAEPGLAQVSKNEMKEAILATPAISDGLIVVRTLEHLYGIGR